MAVILTLCLSSCGKKEEAATDSFSLNIICESEGIYQIYYSCYFDDEYYGMGGMSDLDKKELTADTELKPVFSKSYFEGREDLSGFSIDFSPYGKDDTSEAGTTNSVYIPAEYGGSYTIVFSGDREKGFTAELQK